MSVSIPLIEADRIERFILPTVVGLCGYSNSGKTTLIESVLPPLKEEGLSVGVIKHAHCQKTEPPGQMLYRTAKDTNRYLKAGGELAILSTPSERTIIERGGNGNLFDLLNGCPRTLDLILVEGFKTSGHRKVWLAGRPDGSSGLPPGVSAHETYPADTSLEERKERFLRWIREERERHLRNRPVRAGVLVGGRSTRMGKPKALLEISGRAMAESVATTVAISLPHPVLLGRGPLPASLSSHVSLPDPPHLQGAGPLAGLLSAMRWDPFAAWLLCGVDMPFITDEAIRWIVGNRRPGRWAILPKLPGKPGVEPLLALYEPMVAQLLEDMAQTGELRLQSLAGHPRVLTPEVPLTLAGAFRNINTPEDLAAGLLGGNVV